MQAFQSVSKINMDVRKHQVKQGPGDDPRKTIIVIEDPQLAEHAVRVECAFSDQDFGRVVALAYPACQVVVKKGHPRRTLHI